MKLTGWPACVIVLVALEARATELHVECASVDAGALAHAIDAELADHPGALATHVTVRCAQPGSVEITVEGGGIRRVRTLNLGDVAPALRARLIAIVVAEHRVPAAPPGAEPLPGSAEPAPVAVPPAKRSAPVARLPVARPREDVAASDVELVPAIGVRGYGPRFQVAPAYALALAVDWLELGASFFTVSKSTAAGDVRLHLAAAAAGVRFGCFQGAAVRWCASGRAEAGATWADATAGSRDVEAHDRTAPYLAFSARASVVLPAGRMRVLVDAGWAVGLIARADDAEVVRTAGPFFGPGIGVPLW